MRYIFLLLFLFTKAFTNDNLNFQTSINAKLFSGTWYEIARTYNSFEKDCFEPKVTYSQINETKNFDVVNSCLDKNDLSKEIKYEGSGILYQENKINYLKLTYFWVFTKNYKFIYFNDYKTAVISDEDFENLWIMSRNKKIKKEELEKILNILDKHMDTNELIFSHLNKDLL